MAEEAGLTAEHEAAPSVANPDLKGERSIEAARERQQTEAVKASPPPPPAPRPPTPSKLDRLDRERASDEGMLPPPSSP